MADIENIIANSRTIKQLTKDISTIAKNSGSSGNGGSSQGGITGINRIDQKIDDIKDAFGNNTTVKFLKDPASVMAEGFKGVVKPFTDIPGNLMGSLKKFNPFGGVGSKDFKKLQKSIDKQTKILQGQQDKLGRPTKDEVAEGLSEGVGQKVIGPIIDGMGIAREANLVESVKLRTRFALLGDQITGSFLKFFKVNNAIEGIQKGFLTGVSKLFRIEQSEEAKKQDDFLAALDADLNKFGKVTSGDVQAQMRQEEFLHKTAFYEGGFVTKPLKNILDVLTLELPGIRDVRDALYDIGGIEARRDKKAENKDQMEMELRRDEILRQEQMTELLAQAAGKEKQKGKDKKEDVKKGGIFGWIKKNILGIGAGTVAAGTTAAVGGIGGFFTGLTAIMKGVGTAFPFYAKGAAALSLLALPLLAFGATLPMLTKGLEGFNKEKLGLFAGVITTVGLIAAGLGALIATGVGGLALAGGIVAIAGLGLAIGGFGKGIEVGQKGFDVLTNFFKSLGATPDIGDKIAQVGGLGGALAKIGGGGILSRFSSGPLDKVSDFLDKAQGNTLPATAEGLNRLAVGMAAVSAIELDTDFSKAFKDFSKYTFREDLRKAGDGFATFLKKVNEQLKKLDTSKLETLLQTAEIDLNSINNQGFVMESGARAMSNNSQQGMGFTQVDNSTRSGDQNVSVVNQHIGVVNDDTLRMVAP